MALGLSQLGLALSPAAGGVNIPVAACISGTTGLRLVFAALGGALAEHIVSTIGPICAVADVLTHQSAARRGGIELADVLTPAHGLGLRQSAVGPADGRDGIPSAVQRIGVTAVLGVEADDAAVVARVSSHLAGVGVNNRNRALAVDIQFADANGFANQGVHIWSLAIVLADTFVGVPPASTGQRGVAAGLIVVAETAEHLAFAPHELALWVAEALSLAFLHRAVLRALGSGNVPHALRVSVAVALIQPSVDAAGIALVQVPLALAVVDARTGGQTSAGGCATSIHGEPHAEGIRLASLDGSVLVLELASLDTLVVVHFASRIGTARRGQKVGRSGLALSAAHGVVGIPEAHRLSLAT